MEINYKPPGPVARDFMLDDSFVRGVRGPFGSGKSGTCIMELFRRMCMQRPDEVDNRRKSRTAIIRNTNPQLRSTTIKSYEDWLKPSHFGDIKYAPPPYHHLITVGDLEAEVLFLALDTVDDVRKLLSLELTFAWINEAREVPKSIVDATTGRLRRYPALKDGGATWTGLIMDTNAPDEDHWWPIMAGEAPPPDWMSEEEIKNLILPHNWRFFNQPEAMREVRDGDRLVGYELNELAENLHNLAKGYYEEQITGKTKSWIDVFIRNKLGTVVEGRPVHPNFNREVHVAKAPLNVVPNVIFWMGEDFGLTPAAVLAQQVRGRWYILREVVLENAGAGKLAKGVNRVMAEDFPDHKIRMAWGDPTGDNRGQADEAVPFQTLRTAGIPARGTESNDPELRRAALDNVLTGMVEGLPRIIIDPSCTVLIRGLEGAFGYKRVKTAHGELFADKPDKNRFSHVCEALEYLMLGCGEAREQIGRKQRQDEVRARVAVRRQNPMDRLKKRPREKVSALRR